MMMMMIFDGDDDGINEEFTSQIKIQLDTAGQNALLNMMTMVMTIMKMLTMMMMMTMMILSKVHSLIL